MTNPSGFATLAGMYFRRKKIKNSYVLQLVESYRNAEGQPRQRVVVSLGGARLPEGEEKIIAKAVEAFAKGERELLAAPLSGKGKWWVDYVCKMIGRSAKKLEDRRKGVFNGVISDKVGSENVVELGPEAVGMKAWNELGLDAVLEECGMNRSRRATAALLCVNRLTDPSSELGVAEWAGTTALPEMLNIRMTKSQKDRLYRTGDQLMKHRDAIEEALRRIEKNVFSLRRKIVLYDVTNSHFEGECIANPKAKRGRNKQKRNDCPQVAIGVAYDAFGFALSHELFAGNTRDSATLAATLKKLERGSEEGERPLVILDAGFAAKKNLKWLKDNGYGYVVNITRGKRAKYTDKFDSDGFEEISGRNPEEKIEVKIVDDKDSPGDRLLLCKSKRRREKESAIFSKAEQRLLGDLDGLRKRISKGQLVDPEKIAEAIGRLKERHSRVARYYDITIEEGIVEYSRRSDAADDAERMNGNYMIRTNQADFKPAELWDLYMTLLKAEEGFRMLKGTLGLRPNYHQKEQRVDGHVFITIIAYHLLTWIQAKLRLAGDNREWKSVRRILQTHSLVTVRMSLMDGRVVRIRKPSDPDHRQTAIYSVFGINPGKIISPQKSIAGL